MSDLTPNEMAIAIAKRLTGEAPAAKVIDPNAVFASTERTVREVLSAALAGRVVVDLPTRDQVWETIVRVRDAAPRASNDASTDAVIDALVDAGFLRLAAEGGEPRG